MSAPGVPRIVQAAGLTDAELLELYEYPADVAAPWIRTNFVVSLDGATSTSGSSVGLTSPTDQRLMGLMRELADVVLVGAGTIRTEDYIGIRVSDEGRERRLARGMATVPPIAVVTARADIDPESRLLTRTEVPPIILTTTTASTAAKRNLDAAGATVVELGSTVVDTAALSDALASLGLLRVICEGGPTLTGQLAADRALDELCITTAPAVVGGVSHRVTYTDRNASLAMHCAHIIFDTDGVQFARWVR
ncbi:pyrimidine reductase family protein [Nocardia sp. NPDC048505]|uniref:pyrimidine reductase family protein n=1 Tax=Nocardia sp. NPDC048505 TaxID=3155756 RepID=UPI0033F10823